MIITGPLTSRTSAMLPSGTIPPRSFRTRSCGQVVDLLAEVGLSLHVDLPGAAEPVEVVDVERAQVDLQGVEQLGDRDARQLGLVAVDVEVEPGRVGPEAGEEPRSELAAVRPCDAGDDPVGDVLDASSSPGRRGPRPRS